jgi:hypothetical protein
VSEICVLEQSPNKGWVPVQWEELDSLAAHLEFLYYHDLLWSLGFVRAELLQW